MTPFISEIIGTFLLILIGAGVVANVILNKTSECKESLPPFNIKRNAVNCCMKDTEKNYFCFPQEKLVYVTNNRHYFNDPPGRIQNE